ncbi:MAG: carboxylesterase family protein [Clostridia bacterium]|nr:carboxylesterase family protein [Clostridia bacterium]
MTIFFIILFLLYGIILELSKNTLTGWVIAAAIIICFIVIRARGKRRGTWSRRRSFIAVLLIVLVLGAVYWLTAPPIRQIPAVASKTPEITDTIHVKQGDLTGVYNEEHTARIYAGIPYAKPPVGELRWKEPGEAEPWEGVRACDTFGPMAMQQQSGVLYDSLTHILGYHDYRIGTKNYYRGAMSEDCLYLNVFIPANDSEEALLVLFYIHGGSLMTGQSYYSEYRGEDLAAHGIIVVNFAYRLGVFGYYANEELIAESPNGTTGDYGLLDQIAALAWVRDNIAAFGGDPNQITIAGESAGSSSVNALCVSPLTEGMFVRAIAQSSGIVAKRPYHTFRTMDEALEMGTAIKEEMGADSVAQMRKIPAEELLQTSYQNNAMTVDGYAIREMPYLTYEKGENHEQALLNGFNAKEADAFLLGIKATAENYEELLRPILGDYASDMASLVPAGSIVRDQHFIIDAGGDAKGSLDQVYSAARFTWSHDLWSDYVADEGRPVYEYYFTKTNRSLSNYHAGELPYAYRNLWRHPGIYDEADEALSEIMQSYWVNFVRTGNPNGDGLPRWEMRDTKQKQLIEFGEEIHMADDPYQPIYSLLKEYQDGLK